MTTSQVALIYLYLLVALNKISKFLVQYLAKTEGSNILTIINNHHSSSFIYH